MDPTGDLARIHLVANITAELRVVVRRGPKYEVLGMLPTLVSILARAEGRELAATEPTRTLGKFVHGALVTALNQWNEPVLIFARQQTPEIMRRTARLLLGFDCSCQLITPRREGVIRLLGGGCAAETWRRSNGPEQDYVEAIADLLVDHAEDDEVLKGAA